MIIAIAKKNIVRLFNTETLEHEKFMEMFTNNEAIELSNILNEKIFCNLYKEEKKEEK